MFAVQSTIRSFLNRVPMLRYQSNVAYALSDLKGKDFICIDQLTYVDDHDGRVPATVDTNTSLTLHFFTASSNSKASSTWRPNSNKRIPTNTSNSLPNRCNRTAWP